MHINDIPNLPNFEAIKKRFLQKIEKTQSCWTWTAYANEDGYGRFRATEKFMPLAHRLSFVIFKGPIPIDFCVCHSCDNPTCVNPAHLFAGTVLDNMNDRDAKGRGNQRSGELCGKAKITAKTALKIRNDPRSQHAIARAFGVSRGCVSHIKLRNTWKHI